MNRHFIRLGLCAAMLVALSISRAHAAEPIDYLSQIKPILKARCYACHGGLKQEAGLRLDTAELLLKGGDSGSGVTPGDAKASLLLQRIRGEGGLDRMPLEGAAVDADQIALVEAWINQGSIAPNEPPPADPFSHWAFVAPVRGDGGQGTARGEHNIVDQLIEAKYAELGLVPVGEADKYTLLRRVTIDLTGLPPTRPEIDQFVTDTFSDAYEKVVDRLLASPAYGERWARHWMDVWRYSDWDGFNAEIRESQPHLWRWRDWIVESLNADRSYAEMIAAMLAADERATAGDVEATRDLAATGFLARNYYKFNRSTWLDNTVEHTTKAFLGLTINCARCHDHKYDPIAQKEYYQTRAIFEPYDVRADFVAGQPDTAKNGLTRVYDAHVDRPTYLFHRGNEKEPDETHPLAAKLLRAAGGKSTLPAVEVPLAPTDYYPGLHPFAQADALAAAEAELKQADENLAAARERATPPPPSVVTVADTTDPAIRDNFSQRDDAKWTYDKGTWSYENDRLVQSDRSQAFSLITSRGAHPVDVALKAKLVIRDGNGFSSAGIAFDVVGNTDFNSAYLSAFKGQPGLEMLYRQRNADVYPPESRVALPIASDQAYEFEIVVRGSLVNVLVDGKLVLAHRLPHARPTAGRVALWTFDGAGEFLSFEATALSADRRLVEPEAGTAASVRVDGNISTSAMAESQRLAEQAEATIAVASRRVESVRARSAADTARYAQPPADNSGVLSLAAVTAERKYQLAIAKQAEVAARHAWEAAKERSAADVNALEEKLKAATATVTEAEAAAANPTGDYSPLGKIYPKTSTGRRTALAAAITDRHNPLTARVAVNQLWLRHFNAPLVPTVFDFGLNGKPPLNQRLLDWLACELMDSGWRMKSLHRLLVTSRAYRRASSEGNVGEANRKLDRDNLYLWRMNPRRLEAEAVRDSVLAAADRLDRAIGGVDLDPTADATLFRRSLYFRHSKEKRSVFLNVFDSASATECYRRGETVVPQQALALANSQLVNDAALAIAERVNDTQPVDDRAFVNEAFLTILSRPCNPTEQQTCLHYLQSASNASHEALVRVLLNHTDFVTAR